MNGYQTLTQLKTVYGNLYQDQEMARIHLQCNNDFIVDIKYLNKILSLMCCIKPMVQGYWFYLSLHKKVGLSHNSSLDENQENVV